MRTIKVELELPFKSDRRGEEPTRVRVSTEAVITDETDDGLREAGREAASTIVAFAAGYAEVMGSSS